VCVLLLQRLYVGLPDEEARRGMLETKLGKCAQGLQQADLAHMAACTQDFSGSDIAVLAGHLLMLPVRLTQQATSGIAFHTTCVLSCLGCGHRFCNFSRWQQHPYNSHAACLPYMSRAWMCLHPVQQRGCISRACDNNVRLLSVLLQAPVSHHQSVTHTASAPVCTEAVQACIATGR